MNSQSSTPEFSIDARSYVLGGTLSGWTALVWCAAVLASGQWDGAEWVAGRFHDPWPETNAWSAVLLALLAVGALVGRDRPRVATWVFASVLSVNLSMAPFSFADPDSSGTPSDSPFRLAGAAGIDVPPTGSLLVIAMIGTAGLLLVLHRAAATRTTLATTAAILAAAGAVQPASGIEMLSSSFSFSPVTGLLALLVVTAIGTLDENVAPAILTRARPLYTFGRLALGVTVTIPVLGYIEAGNSLVKPQFLAVTSGLILVAAIAGAVCWFGWADFEAQAWRQIAENATDAVLEVDAQGVIHRATGRCLEVTGWKVDQLTGRSIEDLIEGPDRERHRELTRSFLDNPSARPMGSRAVPVVGPDGNTRLVIARLVPVTRADGLAVCVTLVDASRESELRHRATHDPLTEVLNRSGITEALQRELDTGRDCGVLFVDLDELKSINDDLTHAAGDRALRSVAQAVESELRGRDRVGRIGGDEFACVITNLEDMATLRHAAGRIERSIMEIRVAGPGRDKAVTASIGGILAKRHGDAEEALAAADECMYAVKAAGGNGVLLMDEGGGDEHPDAPGGERGEGLHPQTT
jgi:diguanylate cyclase (GGDEF)-like protein/PAS domain S-box-containing protein